MKSSRGRLNMLWIRWEEGNGPGFTSGRPRKIKDVHFPKRFFFTSDKYLTFLGCKAARCFLPTEPQIWSDLRRTSTKPWGGRRRRYLSCSFLIYFSPLLIQMAQRNPNPLKTREPNGQTGLNGSAGTASCLESVFRGGRGALIPLWWSCLLHLLTSWTQQHPWISPQTCMSVHVPQSKTQTRCCSSSAAMKVERRERFADMMLIPLNLPFYHALVKFPSQIVTFRLGMGKDFEIFD